jgi:hypothetical protein
MPILYDFFLAYTSSALYSIGSNPDSSVSNPYRGFGFPTIYTNYYAQQNYDPDPTRNEWYKHYYFWDDFLNIVNLLTPCTNESLYPVVSISVLPFSEQF